MATNIYALQSWTDSNGTFNANTVYSLSDSIANNYVRQGRAQKSDGLPMATPVTTTNSANANQAALLSTDANNNSIGIVNPAGGNILNLTIKNIALKILPQYRPSYRAVMTTPPTTTFLTTTTIVNPLLWRSETNLTVAGSSFSFFKAGSPIMDGSSYPLYNYIKFSNVNYGGGSLLANSYCVSFLHDGSELEILVRGIIGAILVKVDDQYISITSQIVPNDGGTYKYYIPFGSRKVRRIDAIIANSTFGGINTGPNDTIIPVSARGPRTIIMGDSFTEGTGANVQQLSWTGGFQDYMGWDDIWSSGVGSTGYLATTGSKLKYRDRIATDVIPFNPDIVMVTGGFNDIAFTASDLGAEATLLFQALRTGLPKALLIAVAPFTNKGISGVSKSTLDKKDAIKTAILSVGGIFLDPLEMPLPLNTIPHTTTLATSCLANATTISTSIPLLVNATYKFSNNERFKVKSYTGAGPSTITPDSTTLSAHASGEVLIQVGDSLLTGYGRVGATTGTGNSDLYVSTDGSHPSQAGHDALGQCIGSLLIDALNKL